MKIVLFLALIFAFLQANPQKSDITLSTTSKIYEGCGKDRNDALENLSTTILANVQSDFSQSTKSDRQDGSESIEQKISSILHVSTNLSLVNQNIFKKGNQICISVDRKDQIENTQKLLTNALVYDAKNLPKDPNQRLVKLQEWLSKIKQANNLVLAFFEESGSHNKLANTLATLQKKEKIFNDLYNKTLLQANALVWKSCADTKKEAYADLNKKLFGNKTKKDDDEGVFEKAVSFFSKINIFAKNKSKMLDLFQKQVSYKKDKNKMCALVKKSDLYEIAKKLNLEVARFEQSMLDKDPKERYKQIKDLKEHLNVTKALIELFPEHFDKSDFRQITHVKKILANALQNTHPQYVLFQVIGTTQPIYIKFNGKFVKPNTKIWLKSGKYNYTITSKGKCPINGEIELELQKDQTIETDLSEMNYPLLTFYTKDGARIIANGKILKPNVENKLKKCEGEIKYIVDFADQSKEGTVELSPNLSKTIEIKFFTPKEMAVFNNAKTKYFETTDGVAISDSLTPVASKNLIFKTKEDPKHGDIELDKRGVFNYTPKKGYVGIDSFKYYIETDDETSATKVVNITIKPSNIPTKEKIKDNSDDINTTKAKLITKIKEKGRAIKKKSDEIKKTSKEIKKKSDEIKKTTKEVKKKITKVIDEARYQRFKAYVNSQQMNIEKLKKLQKTYPVMFQRILKEKLEGK